jgi:hypothetical protein
MPKLAFGQNFAVFVLFFALSLIEAIASGAVFRALLWIALGLVFLRADAIAQRDASRRDEA